MTGHRGSARALPGQVEDVRSSDADRLLRFTRLSAPVAAKAAELTAGDDPGSGAHADRLVGHWRREIAPLAAVPGLGGRLSMVVVEVLAATAQGLLVLSLAEVAGEDDEEARVRLVATHALGQKMPRRWSAAKASDPGDPGGDDDSALWARVLQAAPGTVFDAAREMWAVRRLVGKRERGGAWWLSVLRFVPVAGAAAALLSEREALARVARATMAELGLDGADRVAA